MKTTYEILFEEIKKKNSSKNNSIEITPKIFHCDFGKKKKLYLMLHKKFLLMQILNTVYGILKEHQKLKKKELCGDKVEKIKDLYI